MSNTDSNDRPGLTQRTSAQVTREKRDALEREPTVALERLQSSDSLRNRNDVSNSRQLNRPQTAQESVRAQQSNLQRQQTQKKTENRHYVDNDYYSLNPWYEQQPPKPLFGLGRPFPRTVRPGMLWGHQRAEDHDQQEQEKGGQPYHSQTSREFNQAYKDITSNQNARKGPQGALTLQIPPQIDEHGEPQPPPDRFEAELDGYRYIVTRAKDAEADSSDYERGIGREDQLDQKQPSKEAHQGLQSLSMTPDSRGDKSHGDQPPQDDSQSVATAQEQAEKQEIRDREEQAIQDYYNNYRNPIARFRARHPEALAEFLSVIVIMLAGFAAGTLAWFIYRDAIMHIDPQLTPSITGKALYTMPTSYVSVATAFFNDYLSAALYTCVAFAIGDDSNTPPGSGMSALIYGLMSFLLCICFGYNGLGVSPARDLGPRFIAWWVGYGSETFSTGWWAYGPIAAGLSGVLTGALVYDLFIFVGGESPVNYNWPSPKDLRDKSRARKRQAKEKLGKLDV
ncbi:hypothetical protein SLS60_007375 [Paraconiothyrium brasiliense]|uniref:Uncharacterized protein n=1 Tax=Paraconiothyrium brasiliense TaxID=300254 RepID=A0ABR3R5E6_9PLEO